MADPLCRDFQETVARYLARHKSVLDVMSKLQEAGSRTNRAVAKAVTTCGCIKISAGKQQVPPDTDYRDLAQIMSSHVHGALCETCEETLESELGRQLLYLVALCEVLQMDFGHILEKERARLSTLGPFYTA